MEKKVRGHKEKAKGKKKRERKISFKIPKFLRLKDEPIIPRAFSPIDYAGGIVVFFICWVVYLHTLTPTIGFHDSGDMITAAYVLGIPHPTGYPLYCLFGKLWMTILPLGNIAYRMNLASALCASLACMMVYFITLKVGSKNMSTEQRAKSMEQKTPSSKLQAQCLLLSRISSLIPAIVGALMLAFATTFWEQAVIAEKYTLNALFATLLIFILLKWQEAMSTEHEAKSLEQKAQSSRLKAQSYLYLFAFTLGLSFTHHMQTIYLVPASIFFIIAAWWKYRKSLTTYHLSLTTIKLLCLFILPLFLYLYLLIRANQNPPINWSDPETWNRFIFHITGSGYGVLFTNNLKTIFKNIQLHITSFFPDQFSWYFIWIGLVGSFILVKKRQISNFIFLFLIILTNTIYASQYLILNIEDYYIPSFIIFSIWTGYGIKGLFSKKKIFYSFFILIPIILFLIHYHYNNRKTYYFPYDFGMNILNPLKENAIIFTEDDNYEFPMVYLQYIEKRKVDIIRVGIPYLLYDWYVEGDIWYEKQLKEYYPDFKFNFEKELIPKTKKSEITVKYKRINNIISNNIERRSTYLTRYEENIANNYILIPQGLSYQILKKGVDKEKISQELEKEKKLTFRKFDISIFKERNELQRTINTYDYYVDIYNIRGKLYYKIKMYEKAIVEFKKALRIKPKFKEGLGNVAKSYYKIGLNCYKKGMYNEAINAYKESIKINPNDIDTYYNLAILYTKMNNYKEAIKVYKEIIKKEPTDIEVLWNLATIYYTKGLFEKAFLQCREILRLDPDNTYAKQMQKAISLQKEAKVK
ncbi:MAG: DUF2723 domain-containing protein [bacterium]